jgi:glycosyltransferase involved in cell wall biosynthesis
MRIAFYVAAFKENQDGATNSLYMLIRSLQASGMEARVWAYDRNENSGKAWVEKHSVASLPLPIYPAYRISLPQKKIIRQLADFNPHVIHVAVPDLAGRVFLQYALDHHVPVVASYHTNFVSYLKYYHLSFLARRSLRYLADFFNRCRCVYAPTPAAIHDLESWGVQRIRLWSRGVDRRQFNPQQRMHSLRREWRAQERKVILYSGRFVPYKNLDVVIAVYRRFQALAADNVRFVLLGDGPWRGKLQQAMPEAVFPGYLHGRELFAAYASSDQLLFPSTTETFGNVVLEALASGVPAVVSDRGGCADIVRDSGAGIVCPAGEHEAFFQACRKLVEHPATHARLRSLGLDYAAGRSWPAINLPVIEDYRMIAAYGQPGVRELLERPQIQLGGQGLPQQNSI